MNAIPAFLDIAVSQPWCLLQSRAEEYVRILDTQPRPEVLDAYRANRHTKGERLQARDGVAILSVEGPLFKKANLMVEFCGATSYEILRRDLQAALDDPSITSILLNVDSPGGEANGCDELARAIYAARGKKPITAYVSGMAASGGYWIASAAERVVVSDLALLGSIGVVLGVQDRSAADERRGVRTIQFVSSQSPGKRPDVNTDEGKGRVQTMVDDLAEVFISAVAKHRGVSTGDVITKFGAGGVKIGAKAVAAGMADEVGQFEAVLASLKKRSTTSIEPPKGAPRMSSIHADASARENERMRAIIQSNEARGHQALAAAIATETAISPVAAIALLRAAAEDRRSPSISSSSRQPDASAGWSRAVGEANAAIGADGDSRAADDGHEKSSWGRAVGEANAAIGAK